MLDDIRCTVWNSPATGRAYWLFADGTTVLPVISGGDGAGEGAGTGTGAGEGTGAAGTGEGAGTGATTMSQEQVTAIAARERAQGERAAAAKVAEELGMSVDDAKTFIAEAKQRELAAMTEADRKVAEAADATAKATARETAAAAREHSADVRAALIEAGVPRAKAERAARLVDSNPGDDAATITAAVESLRTDWAELFATAEGEGGEGGEGGKGGENSANGGKPNSGTPRGGTPRRSDSKPADGLARGKERAQQENVRRGIVPAATGAK